MALFSTKNEQPTENISLANAPEQKQSGLGARAAKGLLKGAFYATLYPVTILPHKLAYNFSKALALGSETWKGKTASVAVGLTLSAAMAATQIYGGLYAGVSAGDTPVSWDRGTHTGYITRLSNKGVWPCNTWEGELGTLGQRGRKGGTVPTEFAFSFSARRFNPATIEKLQSAQANGELVQISHKQSFYNETLFNSFPFSCVQRTPYQITDVHVIADKAEASDNAVQPHTGELGSSQILKPPAIPAPGR